MKTNSIHKMNSRTFIKFGGALLVLALLVGVGVAIVSAASDGYNIDGVVPDAGATAFADLFGAASELGPVNGTATKLGVINTALPPMLGLTNPNAQVDLRKVWFDTNKDANDDVWLYFAWERDSSNGSGVITFEFQKSQPPADCDYSLPVSDVIADCNPWANRAPGDFIIVWDQKGNTINIIIRTFKFNDTNPANGKWDGNVAEPMYLDAGLTLDSTVSAAKTSSDGFKGEGAINLSDTVFPDPLTECFAYGNVIPGTVTGNSDSADYKDTILDNSIAGEIQVSNCGTLIVKKVVINDDGGTKVAADFSFKVNGGDPIAFTKDGTNDKGKNTQSNLTQGEYTVIEADLPVAGYTTTYKNDYNTAKDCTDLVIAPDATVTCTITNDDIAPTLKLVKDVKTDNGGTAVSHDWNLCADALTPKDGKNFCNWGDEGVFTSVYANAGYVLSETGPSGYTAGAWDCDGGTLVSSTLTLDLDEDVTCTIKNDDTKAAPTGATTMHWKISDTLTITGIRTGSPAPAASVTFKLYSDAGCSTQVGTDSVDSTIVSGVADSAEFTVSTGTYYWKAIYSGDQYNVGFTTSCGYEITTIGSSSTTTWNGK